MRQPGSGTVYQIKLGLQKTILISRDCCKPGMAHSVNVLLLSLKIVQSCFSFCLNLFLLNFYYAFTIYYYMVMHRGSVVTLTCIARRFVEAATDT